ncbi:MAG: excinuclease ABC subunit UvrB [Actinomycetota bacterium]|nr:excinuclease ABC subunit UvrB [Actinomycetota bacterium]
MDFKLVSAYEPKGDQPRAIAELVAGTRAGERYQTLLGVTGSGKTFTMANLIAGIGKPTLVMAPNKTLAAQLCSEFKQLFPQNAVEYFVSYYDYYQPEAYIPHTDTYIEKDASINDEIDKLRHATTSAVLSRPDVVVVASVSCIYGLGSPEEYLGQMIWLRKEESPGLDSTLRLLVQIQYQRNDYSLVRGTFKVRGDVLEIFPPYEEAPFRVEFFGDAVERILRVDPITGEILADLDKLAVFPASHYVASPERLERAVIGIEAELKVRLAELDKDGKLLESQRLAMRTRYDLEMMREIGFCSGIENYSRHFDGRAPGEPPFTLIDYFPDDFLVMIDESHVTIPQVHGMYGGDKSRKETLIGHGFRLPSALDNRPLRFEEFIAKLPQAVFVSATPGQWELEVSGQVVEQIIRPTGLVDPEVSVRPIEGQIDDLLHEIRGRVAAGERVLVTTLTKKMAEDLTDYLLEVGVKVRYLHSDVVTMERIEILRDLRLGRFDVLVGINLLREGLDLPEVSLVAILDADKEGFLRSDRSLIQTIGRAARNVSGEVIMYAAKMTDSMKRALDETNRRRVKQVAYNTANGIEPESIRKVVADIIQATARAEEPGAYGSEADITSKLARMPRDEIDRLVQGLEEEMRQAAEELNFEYAAQVRDRIQSLREDLGRDTGKGRLK